jgi:hypothetical protein
MVPHPLLTTTPKQICARAAQYGSQSSMIFPNRFRFGHFVSRGFGQTHTKAYNTQSMESNQNHQYHMGNPRRIKNGHTVRESATAHWPDQTASNHGCGGNGGGGRCRCAWPLVDRCPSTAPGGARREIHCGMCQLCNAQERRTPS